MEIIILLGIAVVVVICGGLLVVRFAFREEIKAIKLARHVGTDIPCLRCSDCCAKTVIVSRKEIEQICHQTGMKEEEFCNRRLHLRYLKHQPNGHCIFQEISSNSTGDEIASCKIYQIRPTACRKFPHLKYLGVNGLDGRCRAVRQKVEDNRGLK